MTGIRDRLNEEKSAEGTGDYADWFEPSEGDELVGVVVSMHEYNGKGGSGEPIPTIAAIEDCAIAEGSAAALKGWQVQLQDFAERLEVGDAAFIEHSGTTNTENNYDMNEYKTSSFSMEEWQDGDDGDHIAHIMESSPHYQGPPVGDADSTVDSLKASASSSDDSDSGSESDGEITEDVVNNVKKTIDTHGGEIPLSDLDEMVNNVRDFGVDTSEAAKEAGFSVMENDDGDEIVR